MSFDVAKQVIDYFVRLWEQSETQAETPYVGISFYGGEPLLNQPLIEKIISYVKTHITSRKIMFSMTTNAMLLDRYVDFIVDNGFNLMISLDGDEYSDSYRVQKNGKPSFHIVVKNIRFLQEKYPDFFKNKVIFNSVIHNRNSVEAVYDFFMKEFGKAPFFSEIADDGVREDMLEAFNQTFRSLVSSINESDPSHGLVDKLFNSNPLTMELNNYLRNFSGNYYRTYNELFGEVEATRIPSGVCYPFSKKMFVTVKGKILQCERIAHNFTLGSVDKDGVHLDVEKIVEDFNRRLDIMQRLCDNCYNKVACPSCMYRNYGLDEGRPQCNFYMNESEYESYVQCCKDHLYDHPDLYRRLWTEIF